MSCMLFHSGRGSRLPPGSLLHGDMAGLVQAKWVPRWRGEEERGRWTLRLESPERQFRVLFVDLVGPAGRVRGPPNS